MTTANRWIRRIAWTLAILVALIAAAIFAGLQLGERRMQRTVSVPPLALELRNDPATLDRGKYLYSSRGCVDCHGANGAGRVFAQDANGLKLAGSNISPGPGSVVARYTAADWERTLRHGVKPDGRPIMVMPSEDYNRLTNDDLVALVAHVRQLAPATGGAAVVDLPLPARVLYGFGLIKDAAAKIDHALPPATPVPEGVTVAHGAYVANMCLGCHGPQLAGGKIPGGPPDWPAAADLRPGPAMARYADPQVFARMFKTGKRPDGSGIQVMPFESLREISDTDVQALHLYLRSLPKAG